MTEFRAGDHVEGYVVDGSGPYQGYVLPKTEYTHDTETVVRPEGHPQGYFLEGLLFRTSTLSLVAKDGFVTKDSGTREEFGNGSVRDTEEGKPRYDLISPVASKRRAELMARGAVKYGERNWELGQPTSRFLSSLMRHVEMYRLGDRSEDHLAAIGYNADAIMHFEGTEWDDNNTSSK